jgi:hypothetical protein
MKLTDLLETISDKHVMSLYNPDSETYRNTTTGGRIPNTKSISKRDITTKGTQVDFPTSSDDVDQFNTATRAELTKEVHTAIDQLPRRYALVLKAQFGIEPFNNPMTNTQIANVLGISDNRVGQIGVKALKLLRNPKISRKLRSFATEAEEQEQPQQPPLPIDLAKIQNVINQLEISKTATTVIADQMREEIQNLVSGRQTDNPEVILQLLTLVLG